jgi:UDP-2-acetamido-2-deoxy-ribo-hexuluronate aminotransferase
VGPGDEVVTTPFSFIATAEVIALLGAKPIFVDIEPDTFNIDATLLDHALSERTKAVIPVSLYGQCPDFDSINQSVARKQIPVFEDAAQSFGATYKGVKSCALSEIAATSFFPSKPLAGYGEGGALFTNDEELAKSVKEIRAHGEIQRYQHQRLGLNARLDSFQAAILLAKFERLPWEIDRRARIGARYTEMLSGIKGVAAPVIKPDRESVFAQYTIRVNDRERFASALQRLKAPYAIHYPKPLHLQPVFKNFGYSEGDFPVAEKASKEVISLPMHPYLTRGQQEKIVEIIYEAMKSI